MLALAVALCFPLSSCRCGASTDGISVGAPAPTSSGGFGVMARGGPEVWTIDGKPFSIRSTYYVTVHGRLQYTADYLCGQSCPDFNGMSEDQAFAVALPPMKHIVTNGLYRRATFSKDGQPVLPELIGVAITTQEPSGREFGYRVSRTIDQVRAAIQTDAQTPR